MAKGTGSTRASTQVDARARSSREQDLRENDPVHDEGGDTPWQRPESLDAPPPRPGMRQKWVRTAVAGKDDSRNLVKRIREGWKPRDPATVSKKFPMPTVQHSGLGHVIRVESMILMEMPLGKVKQRNAHYDAKKQLMTDAIEREIGQASAVAKRGSGFGEIRKAEKTTPAREVRAREDEEPATVDD